MAQRKAQCWILGVCPRPRVCSACSAKKGAPGPGLLGDQGHPIPASSAFGMLLNPVTFTPFSVNDILRLEREQIDSESLQLRGTRKIPESFQCLRFVPEPRKAEVPSTYWGGCCDSGRRQDESGSPGGPCETVTDMDAERVGEPGEYVCSGLGSYQEIMALGASSLAADACG